MRSTVGVVICAAVRRTAMGRNSGGALRLAYVKVGEVCLMKVRGRPVYRSHEDFAHRPLRADDRRLRRTL